MGKFQYKPPSKESVKKRGTQQGGQFDTPYKPEFKVFAPKEGDHRIRPLPATFPKAEHFGIDVWLHSGVGANNDTYLCANKMNGEDCCVCEEQTAAAKAGDTKYADQLKPYRRVLEWVIVRGKEKEGPQLYPMPWTMDRDVMARAVDKATQEVLYIDDPENGFDVEFTREGTGQNTKYVAAGPVRRSSPLSDDDKEAQKWLDYAVEHPLPEVLNFYEQDYIRKVFEGKGKPKDDEEETEKKPKSRHDDDDEKPAKKKPADDDDDRPTRTKVADDDDDRPAKKRVVDNADEDIDTDKPVKKRAVEEEDDRPTRTKVVDDDDDRPAKKKPVEDDDDRPVKKRAVEEEDDRPVKKRVVEEEDDRPVKKRVVEEEDDRPVKKRVDDEEDTRSKVNKALDDDEDERPAKARVRTVEEEDDRPAKKRIVDDEEEPKPKKKVVVDDDE